MFLQVAFCAMQLCGSNQAWGFRALEGSGVRGGGLHIYIYICIYVYIDLRMRRKGFGGGPEPGISGGCTAKVGQGFLFRV